MKLYVCANGYNETQIKQALECVDVLKKLNHECSINENPNLSYHNFDPQDCDLIVSLGGDGALLRASKVALEYDKPLIGINAGRLGYLCALSIEEVEKFNEILDSCILENRSILKLTYNNNEYLGVNDIMIGKTNFGKTVDLNVYHDEMLLMKVRGDGFLISTPTGSTAYNASAGGPLLDKESDTFVITPICSHDTRPYVIADNKKINIKLNHDDAGIYVDGEYIDKCHDAVLVSKANHQLKLYCRK